MIDFHYKLGKKPARPDAVKLKLVDYETPQLPTAPAVLKHYTSIGPDNWQMLGNDRVGDCFFAGSAHEHILAGIESGQKITFTTTDVLNDYSAATGYNSSNPDSDQGTDMQEGASYRRKTGLVDAHGNRHKVAAYVAIRKGNLSQLKTATFLFGAVGIGIEFPKSAMSQFNANKPWSVVSSSEIEGGHYIPVVGYDATYIYVVTWGRLQRMTHGFFARYCDEAIAYLAPDFFHEGVTIDGFNLSQLQADLASLAAA